MINYHKDFLLNIFFIFFPLVFYPYTLKARSNHLLHRFLLYILFAVPLISTMSFPLKLHGLIYDFRSIPLTIGFLYGGPQVAMLLYITLVLYRYVTENPSNLLYCISLLPSYFIVLLYMKTRHSLKLYRKVMDSIIICSLIKLLTFTIFLSLTSNLGVLYKYPLRHLGTFLLQGFIIGLYVYLLETVNKYFIMQDEVIKSEKIKIVSDIAASVAHEIRNPLTAVKGFIQLMGSDNLNQDRREFYQKICLEELDRAQLIISDYLSLAKPDPEHVEKLDINTEITYVSNILLTYAKYKNVQIHVNLLENTELLIKGDRYKLRQALINIGKNAIEAMPEGGLLEFKLSEENHAVVLTVCDTGVGMTAQQINRLGTPYYSTKEKGTGLGTMVSFGIIRKMDGKIDIKSELGKGTEYNISFPVV